jgi:hypothetical protein
MCAGSGSGGNGDRPSIGAVISNWTDFDAPFTTKLRMTARNLWRRVVLRQGCCGNHGQPGC